MHCGRKSVLEVEFTGEEGTGLGPTLEFYALVAGELQRKDLGMWLCEDVPEGGENNRTYDYAGGMSFFFILHVHLILNIDLVIFIIF